jgi:hypothetical protein
VQILPIRTLLNLATRFPKRCCETVTALCGFTAHVVFITSASSSTTSDGVPRIVDVIDATVTVDKYAMAVSRVSTMTGKGGYHLELFFRPCGLHFPGQRFGVVL